ncbi:two-component system response regulator CreB [Luteimonas changyuni]|uniref:two-component system response regulator CreB n=1 Tax=Luteimonas sp. MJ145 TaxID=3129234 RepID=UPI0031BA0EDC
MLRAMPAHAPPPPSTLLLVEDDPAIAEAVLYALRAEGHVVEHLLLGGGVAARVRAGGVDLVLLDVGLPDIGGFEVCRQLRAFSAVPVVFLSARGDEVDRVLGLELGADDYIAKPFSLRELAARVRARLRRHPAAAAEPGVRGGSAPADCAPLRHGRFEHDPAARRVRFDGALLDLTRYEYALLAELLRRPGAILSRAQLLDRAWEDALDSGERTVDTHVKTLRGKLRAVDAGADPVRTHRGIGYSLDVD